MMRWWRRRRHDHAADPLVCQEFVELVTDYLEGTLPETDRIRFEAHLAECDGCAGYLEDIAPARRIAEQRRRAPPDPETRQALTRAFRELRGDT